MTLIKRIFMKEPFENPPDGAEPACDWWTVTTDDDDSMGNPDLWLAVETGADAPAIAAEYAADRLHAVYYARAAEKQPDKRIIAKRAAARRKFKALLAALRAERAEPRDDRGDWPHAEPRHKRAAWPTRRTRSPEPKWP